MVPKIIDEYTDRDDLTPTQKWYRRHPEKAKEVAQLAAKKAWANKTPTERQKKNQEERERWAEMPLERKKNNRLLSRYGLTYEEFIARLEAQDSLCLLCDREIYTDLTSKSTHDKACVDHCHETGKVRGILCNHCNRALGLVHDNVYVLEKMVKYLKENS